MGISRSLFDSTCSLMVLLLATACGSPAAPAVPQTVARAAAAPAATQPTEPVRVEPTSKPRSKWNPVETDPQPGAGADFAKEVALLYRVVACGGHGQDEVPPPLDAEVVASHCKELLPAMQTYRDKYLAQAVPFFAGIRPEDLPPTVVYPFGGGDLSSALLVFPDALEITTISLEYAGDPRRLVHQANKKVLEKGLALIRQAMSTYLRGQWNWTRNMEAAQQAGVPEQIGYALAAMVIHNYEPISLRYFRLKRDGSVHYLDETEIESLADKRPEQLRQWGAPDYSKAFSNAEIRFRKRGGGPVKIFRHMAENLSDQNLTSDTTHLTKDPSLLSYLEARGPVSALTRAASHLLWEDYFSEIRSYLVRNLVWMPSDSTGIPPPVAAEAGLVQDTYGTFEGVYIPGDQGDRTRYDQAIQDLFARNPKKPLGFLFGYWDKNKNGHLIVTRRPDVQ